MTESLIDQYRALAFAHFNVASRRLRNGPLPDLTAANRATLLMVAFPGGATEAEIALALGYDKTKSASRDLSILREHYGVTLDPESKRYSLA